MIKLMYSVFLGLVIVMFVGVGVSTFYSSPQEPVVPDEVAYIEESGGTNGLAEEEPENVKVARQNYDKEWDAYEKDMQTYNRNVAIITMVIAVGLLLISVTQAEKLAGISEGVLLGGIFTLFYSLIRGLMSGNDMMRFLVITAGLIIALWLGNKKFVQVDKKTKAKG